MDSTPFEEIGCIVGCDLVDFERHFEGLFVVGRRDCGWIFNPGN